MTAENPEAEILPHTNVPKSFSMFLMEQQHGAVHAELSEKLRDLVEGIEMHFSKFPGKTQGELQIKIKITLDRGVYKVQTDYGVKMPKAPVAETMMWLSGGGDLQTTNPRQLQMFGDRPQVVT